MDSTSQSSRRTFLSAATVGIAASPLSASAVQQPAGSDTFLRIDVRAMGAVGDGKSAKQDQAAFERAIAQAGRSGRYVAGGGASAWVNPQDGLYLPPGTYDVGSLRLAGNTTPAPALSIWAMPGTVVIRIPDEQYLFEVGERLNWLDVHGVNFIGGKGVFRSGFAGENVNGMFRFERCVFDNYSECAIGNNAVDMPMLRVRDCMFMARPDSRAIAIAWGGYADQSIIEGNSFLRNRYDLKLGPRLSGSIHVLRNDFIGWDSKSERAASIWIVPNSDEAGYGANAGGGTIISGNKFGNEWLPPTMPRILIAAEDEASGSDRLNRGHATRWIEGGPRGGYVRGLTIENSRIVGGAQTMSPVIRSHIAELSGLSYLNNRHEGGAHTYLCEFMGRRQNSYANMDWTVDVSSVTTMLGSPSWTRGITNMPVGPIADPSGAFGMEEATMLSPTSGDDTSFVALAAAHDAGHFVVFGGARATAVPDHAGHRRAVEIVVSEGYTGIALPMRGVRANRMGWASVDLMRADTASATLIEVSIYNHADNVFARKVAFHLPERWMRARLPFMLPETATPGAWQFYLRPVGYAANANRFRAARAYVHHGREPAHDGHLRTLGDGTWNGSHIVLGTTHIWEAGGKLLMKTGGAPTAPTDGTPL